MNPQYSLAQRDATNIYVDGDYICIEQIDVVSGDRQVIFLVPTDIEQVTAWLLRLAGEITKHGLD